MNRMKTIATIQGQVQNDAFLFPLTVNGTRVGPLILDTGAFELTFTEADARRLQLPVQHTIYVGGVGGRAIAHQSECQVRLGRRVFQKVPCLIDPSLQGHSLFGLRFFIDNKFALSLNPGNGILRVLAES